MALHFRCGSTRSRLNFGTSYVLMNKGGTSQDYRLYINSSGYLIFHIQSLVATNVTPTVTPTPPANTADIVGPQLPLNTWTHIAASYNPSAGLMKLYLNGTLIASQLVTGTITYNTSYGITLSDPTNPFYGMMDEVSIYGAALSDFPSSGSRQFGSDGYAESDKHVDQYSYNDCYTWTRCHHLSCCLWRRRWWWWEE